MVAQPLNLITAAPDFELTHFAKKLTIATFLEAISIVFEFTFWLYTPLRSFTTLFELIENICLIHSCQL